MLKFHFEIAALLYFEFIQTVRSASITLATASARFIKLNVLFAL